MKSVWYLHGEPVLNTMLRLNANAVHAARRRIHSGQYIDVRQTHQRPLTREAIEEYIDRYGWTQYASWFLAIDPSEDEYSILRYRYPYGNLEVVSKARLEESLEELDRFGDYEIEQAITHLMYTLDED